MKKESKRIVILCGSIVILLACFFLAPYLRVVLGRMVGSVPSKTAIQESEKELQRQYPEFDLKWIHGSYLNTEGKWDDTCYTSDFMVNKEDNNIISATYCESDTSGVLKSNATVTIAQKAYERKLVLVKAFADKYSGQLRKQTSVAIEDVINSSFRSDVITPFSNVNYDKVLPESITYGTEFDKSLPLEWEYQIVIRDYTDHTYDTTIRAVVAQLIKAGFSFDKYNFIFVNEVNEATYIYDISQDILANNNIDDYIQSDQATYGNYIPYGEEVKY